MKISKPKNLLNTLEQQIVVLGVQEMINNSRDQFQSQGYRIYKGIPGKRIMKNTLQFGTGFIFKKRNNRINHKL